MSLFAAAGIPAAVGHRGEHARPKAVCGAMFISPHGEHTAQRAIPDVPRQYGWTSSTRQAVDRVMCHFSQLITCVLD
jgi:hypothetical protein